MSDSAIHAADRELFEQARKARFDGAPWKLLADGLVRHGLTVLRPWIRTGRIFEVAASKGYPLSATAQERELIANSWIDDFVQESVASALRRFRHSALAGTGWRPDGGATLAAYFIGACVQAFVEYFRKVRKSGELYSFRFAGDLVGPAGFVELMDRRVLAPDPAQSVVDRLALDSKLAGLSERDRQLVLSKADGYRAGEIAELYGWKSAKAVERRWARLRSDCTWIRGLFGEEI